MNKSWKRFRYFENGLAVFFMINLFLDIFNEKVLNLEIPHEIIVYLFWLSFGLYMGFRLCKHEFNRIIGMK